MTNSAEKKPLIRQGWLRALLFIACYFFISLLVFVPVVLWVTPTSGEDLQNDILGSLSNLATGDYFWLVALMEGISSVACAYLLTRWVDRKSFASLGFLISRPWNDMLALFFIPPAVIGTATLVLCATGHLIWDDVVFDASSLLIQLGALALAALAEELVFRGYLLNNLMQSMNKWVALPVVSLLFALFHLSNPGMGPIAFVNLFLVGLLIGINYIYTHNLGAAIVMHFSWNFFQGPLSGLGVGRVNASSLLQPQMKGDVLLTGGDAGFEGSFVATGILFIAILLLYLFYEKNTEKRDAATARQAISG
jgi:membrane protease YdiL (CAAX protease family)